jgi:hypothetical protein
MKHPNKYISDGVLIACLSVAALTGCVGGYVEGGGGPDYYGNGPWIDNNVVITGGRGWYGHNNDHAYVHPNNRPAGHADNHSAPHAAPHGDDHHR